MSIIEGLWSARRVSYPRGAHIPRRDSLAAQQNLEDQKRRTTNASSTLESYRDRRRESQGRRPSLLQDTTLLSDGAAFKPTSKWQFGGISSTSFATEASHATISSTRGSQAKAKSPSPPVYRRQRNVTIKPIGTSKNYPILIQGEFHRIMFDFCESRTFSGFILLIILLNTAILVAQTWQIVQVRLVWYFACIDNLFLGIYLMELVVKLYVWRVKYFDEGWNWLDFTIVVFNAVDFAMPLVIQNVGDFNGAAIFRLLRIFRAIRALRALRVLRTIRFLANLQVIMTTILQSIRSIGAIVMLIMLVMYMFAVIGRGLYSRVDPETFGNLFYASFTLFQLLTLDDWFDIYKNVVNEDPSKWHIILYLLLYIVVEYFIFLNLFVAVLVDNFHLTIEAQNAINAGKKRALEDSDDEENVEGAPSELSDVSSGSDFSDDQKFRKGVEQYYCEVEDEEVAHLKQYFRLRSAIEYNMHVLGDQQRILNMMVDLCTENADDV